MKDDLEKIYGKIKPSKELDEKVFAKTIRRGESPRFEKKKMPRFAMISLIVLALGTLGCGAVFAKEYIESYILKRQGATGIYDDVYTLTLLNPVKIKENASLTLDDNLSLDNVEKQLGISLLGHGEKFKVNFTNDERLSYVNKLEDGKITDVKLFAYDIYIYDNEKSVDMGVEFFTNYADDEIIGKYRDKEIITSSNAGEIDVEKIYIKNLNTFAYFTDMSMGHFHPGWSCIFVTDNMLYDFHASDMTKKELVEFLENIE